MLVAQRIRQSSYPQECQCLEEEDKMLEQKKNKTKQKTLKIWYEICKMIQEHREKNHYNCLRILTGSII